jgi:hypothetical protein
MCDIGVSLCAVRLPPGRELANWTERLAGAPPALDLPADRPRPAAQTHRGARHPFRLPAPLTEALREVGCGLGTWLAVFKGHGVEEVLGVEGAPADPARLDI